MSSPEKHRKRSKYSSHKCVPYAMFAHKASVAKSTASLKGGFANFLTMIKSLRRRKNGN